MKENSNRNVRSDYRYVVNEGIKIAKKLVEDEQNRVNDCLANRIERLNDVLIRLDTMYDRRRRV